MATLRMSAFGGEQTSLDGSLLKAKPSLSSPPTETFAARLQFRAEDRRASAFQLGSPSRALAVEAVIGELVSASYFPVSRVITGKFWRLRLVTAM
jgi:hypothetical protein